MCNKLKLAILPALVAFSSYVSGQITVLATNFPVPGDTVWLSTASASGIANPALTGTNYTWDYSALQYQTQKKDSFLSVSATPFAYQLYFNNQFQYPENKATVALPGAAPNIPGGQVTITNLINFYKRNSTEYSQTGFGATVNSIPSSIRYDDTYDMDILYKFPLQFGNGPDSSFSTFGISLSGAYYGSKRHRKNEIEGWGTVITPYGSFPCLKIKSTSFIQDTLNYNNFAVPVPARTEIEYKWVTQNHAAPVLTIVKTNNNISRVEYINNKQFAGVKNISADKIFEIFPSLVNDFLRISFNATDNYRVNLLNAEGKMIRAIENIHDANYEINVSDLSSGIYFVNVLSSKGYSGVKKFIKE